MGQSILFLNKKIGICCFIVLFGWINGNISYSQTNDLTKVITLQADNEPIRQIFASITKQIGLRFSYNPNVLDEKMLISIHVENKSLDEVLSLILPDSVAYKQISDYIILMPARENSLVLSEKVKKQEDRKSTRLNSSH